MWARRAQQRFLHRKVARTSLGSRKQGGWNWGETRLGTHRGCCQPGGPQGPAMTTISQCRVLREQAAAPSQTHWLCLSGARPAAHGKPCWSQKAQVMGNIRLLCSTIPSEGRCKLTSAETGCAGGPEQEPLPGLLTRPGAAGPWRPSQGQWGRHLGKETGLWQGLPTHHPALKVHGQPLPQSGPSGPEMLRPPCFPLPGRLDARPFALRFPVRPTVHVRPIHSVIPFNLVIQPFFLS